MKNKQSILLLSLLTLPYGVLAADSIAVSPSGGMLKMVLGLALVLAVMALITWALKRVMPNIANKHSVVRVVGGVSVGSRERVLVLEVGDRWLVVGVAPGQVSQIANLEIGSVQSQYSASDSANGSDKFTNTFAQWLTKSTGKIIEKSEIKKSDIRKPEIND